jgi:hypothetical protein
MKRPYTKYLKTLRRIPDDIILDVAARDLDLNSGNRCICGWVIRDLIASTTGSAPEDTAAYDFDGGPFAPSDRCRASFGGSKDEWDAVYFGVGVDPAVELAFVHRVKEAVGA